MKHVSVRVVASAKREKVEELKNGRLNISVKEPAEQNRANRRTLELVAEYFGAAKNKVHIISGHKSPAKVFSVET
jgi:uncharacterized protein (TIGR00251 family)